MNIEFTDWARSRPSRRSAPMAGLQLWSEFHDIRNNLSRHKNKADEAVHFSGAKLRR